MTSASYIGLDLSSVRKLKNLQDSGRVRAKTPAKTEAARVEQAPVDRQALERAGRKLDFAGHTVHQVEDLLADTIIGIRSNVRKGAPVKTNDRLLRSAEETADDILGYARYENELLFPVLTAPMDAHAAMALGAYGVQRSTLKAARGESDLPEVHNVIVWTNQRLRGEGGVIPKIGELSEAGASNTEETVESLDEIKMDVRTTRMEIEQVKREAVDARLDTVSGRNDTPGGSVDLAS